jgi:hypothetical protein
MGAGVGLVFFNEGVRQMVTEPPSVTGKLRLAGFSASSLARGQLALLSLSLATAVRSAVSATPSVARHVGHRARRPDSSPGATTSTCPS